MFGLALLTLRARAGSFIASFIALFFGASIVLACGGLLETGIRLDTPPVRLAAAPIIVTGDQFYPEHARLSAADASAIASVPGVQKVVPDVSFPAALVQDGRQVGDAVSGHGWQSTQLGPYEFIEGHEPVHGEVAISQDMAEHSGVRTAQMITLIVNGTTEQFRVAGIVQRSGAASAVFFAPNETTRLLGYDTVDNLGVLLNENASVTETTGLIQQKLANSKISILTGNARGQAEFADAKPSQETLIVLAAVFGGIAIMVAILIVGSTLGLSIQQRLREIALLRAIGALPSQLRRMIVAETLVVALLAGALAQYVGAPLGQWILTQLSDAGVVSSQIVFHQGWIPLAAAGGIGLLTALTAALVAAKTATKVRPVEALEHSFAPRRWASWPRIIVAAVFMAGGIALGVVTLRLLHGPVAASTIPGMAILWAIGFALIAPAVASVLVALLSLPVKLIGGLSGYLAALNLRARPLRLASVLIPIMLTTGIATALMYMQTTLATSAQRTFAQNLKADAVVVSTGGGLPLATVDVVGRAPNVGAASALTTSSGFFVNDDGTLPEDADADTLSIQGLTAGGASATTAYHVAQGDLANLHGSTVAFTVAQARGLNKQLGDTVAISLGDGTLVQPKIVALFDLPPGYETVLMPADVVAQHSGTGLISQVLVAKASGVSTDQLLRSLDTLAVQHPGVRVASSDELKTLFNQGEQTGVWITYLLAGMIVGYTVISLVNSLILSVMERKREFALQRLTGATKGQIITMMTIEGSMTAVAGALFGTVIATLILTPFAMGLKDSPWPEGPLWIYLTVVGFTTLLTLCTTILITAAALRGKPVETVGSRE